MKKINNKKGVSAIIGVILMVAITVVIAGTVYVYISGMMDTDFKTSYVVEGEFNYIYNTSDDMRVLIVGHTAYNIDNPISDFDALVNGDNIRLFFYGNHIQQWEFI